MRRNWLAGAAVAAALSVPMAGVAEAAQAAPLSSSQHTAAATRVVKTQPAGHRRYESFDMRVATYVKRFIGAPYVYRHFGKRIPRTAEDQFLHFRRISKARAWGGDLVFFHVSSNPYSYVYHVGIYEGGHTMIAATTPAGGVRRESFLWAGNTVTFGTITH